MSATMQEVKPVTADRLKEYFCQGCGRFVFRSTSLTGISKIKCESCNVWTWYDHEREYPPKLNARAERRSA